MSQELLLRFFLGIRAWGLRMSGGLSRAMPLRVCFQISKRPRSSPEVPEGP